MAGFPLNPEQQHAVERTEGPVLILAGAGTGKTRVITSRIAHLVERGVAPESILAVTFTNKAANEMRERVGGAVKKEAASGLTVCTFHSLCVRILRRGIERLGYKSNFSIYTGSDQVGLVRRLIVQKAGRDEKLDPNLALSLISQAKNKGIPVHQESGSLMAEIERAYRNELKTLNAVDFDDLLILAVKVLRENEDIRDEWRARYRYLMVDEFQDTNRLQMDLVRQLTGPERNVCVVGDDDQSIYGWRGAEITNILEFEKGFPGAFVVKLEQNYRSTNPILSTANSLIRHNRGRREKNLWSQNAGQDPVQIVAMPGEEQEAEHVVNQILEERGPGGRSWEDFAVLLRMNAQTRNFEEALRRHEIPYRVIGGQSFYDRREVKDLLAYLNVFFNPDDDVNLLRVINTPPRGLGSGTVTLATDHSVSNKTSVFGALQDSAFTGGLSTRASGAIDRFIGIVEEGHELSASKTADYAGFMERFIEETHYLEYVKRGCKTDDEAASREQNVREFITSLHRHRARSGAGLRGFLDEVSLMRDRDEDRDEKDQAGVSLITLHAAKGLEFPVVFLVGLEEGILPHSRSVDEGSRDEERRLLYVGITRAMERLTISYCLSRKRWGETLPSQPSSFLEELADTHLERLTYEEVSKEPAPEDLAEDYFARMKEMLGTVDGYELED